MFVYLSRFQLSKKPKQTLVGAPRGASLLIGRSLNVSVSNKILFFSDKIKFFMIILPTKYRSKFYCDNFQSLFYIWVPRVILWNVVQYLFGVEEWWDWWRGRDLISPLKWTVLLKCNTIGVLEEFHIRCKFIRNITKLCF